MNSIKQRFRIIANPVVNFPKAEDMGLWGASLRGDIDLVKYRSRNASQEEINNALLGSTINLKIDVAKYLIENRDASFDIEFIDKLKATEKQRKDWSEKTREPSDINSYNYFKDFASYFYKLMENNSSAYKTRASAVSPSRTGLRKRH